MRRKRTGYLLLLPSLILICCLILYPTIKTFIDSFFNERTQLASIGKQFVGFENYLKAFNDEHFIKTLIWTLIFTFVSVAIELVIGMLLAMLMNKPFKGQNTVRASVLVPWAIPTIVSGIIWAQFFSQNGVINYILDFLNVVNSNVNWLGTEQLAKLAILIADIWKNTPYMSLLLLSGLVTIPKDYYEAAEIDGATKAQQFINITLPLIKPTMMVTVLFRIISSLRVYDLIVAMTNGGPGGSTETVSMYAIKTYFNYGNIGYGSALSILMLLVAIMISMIFSGSLKTRLE